MTRLGARRYCLLAAWLMVALAAAPAGQERASSFEDVVARLKSPDAGERLDAVRTLAATGYLDAAVPLAGALGDSDRRVARGALYGELGLFLGSYIESDRRVAFVFELPQGNPASQAFDDPWASLPVAPVPAEVLQGLAARVTVEDLQLRVETVYALGVLGQVEGAAGPEHQAAAEAIAQRLGDSQPAVRIAAARAAGRMFRRCAAPCQGQGVQRLGDALVHSLNDPEQAVLMAVIEGLGEMRYERGVQGLTALNAYFKNGPPFLASLDALGRIGHPSSIPLFKQAAARKEPAARRAAVEGLARAADAEGLKEAAAKVQAERNTEVSLGLAFALQKAGQGDHVARIIGDAGGRDTWLQAQDYLVELGPPVAGQVAAALPVAETEARARLIQVLGAIGSAKQVPSIEAARANASGAVAAAADHAIRRIKAFQK